MHIETSVKRSALILLTGRRVSPSRRVVRCKVHTKNRMSKQSTVEDWFSH